MQDSLPAGWLAFAGRELNPLDRYERFPSCYISSPFPEFILTLDGSEHDGTLAVVGMTMSRGARFCSVEDLAPHTCIRWTIEVRNHDAWMRIGERSSEAGTHSVMRHESHAAARGRPPPRTVIGDPLRADQAETIRSPVG